MYPSVKDVLDLFRSTTRKRNIMAKLAQPNSWTGANSSKRKTRQIGEGNNQTLSAVACVVHTYKVLRYERKRVKNNSFFCRCHESWLKKTVLSVKKTKEWKKKIIIEDWCFCYNGLQRFSTLHRLRLQHVLPVGVSGIISMLNLCDINEKFPNSNTWVHLSSIWLVFFSSQSSLLSPLILLACRCNMEQKFDLFSQNCFNFVEMITCQGRRNVKEFGEDKLTISMVL